MCCVPHFPAVKPLLSQAHMLSVAVCLCHVLRAPPAMGSQSPLSRGGEAGKQVAMKDKHALNCQKSMALLCRRCLCFPHICSLLALLASWQMGMGLGYLSTHCFLLPPPFLHICKKQSSKCVTIGSGPQGSYQGPTIALSQHIQKTNPAWA